eukprot:417810-Amphidinium_carterae.1
MALAVSKWGGKVVSMEMDPVNATIARNHIDLAGLSDAVTVQLGHSDDAVQVLLEEYGPGSFDMVFMDQRGTAFHEDLRHLECIGLLTDPCVVVADNVLKPGPCRSDRSQSFQSKTKFTSTVKCLGVK